MFGWKESKIVVIPPVQLTNVGMVSVVLTSLVLPIPTSMEHNVFVLTLLKGVNLGSTMMELDVFTRKGHVHMEQHGMELHVLQIQPVLKDFMDTTTTVKLYLKNAFLPQFGVKIGVLPLFLLVLMVPT